MSELAVHRLDLVLSDRPIPTNLSVKAYSYLLVESAVSSFAERSIARSTGAVEQVRETFFVISPERKIKHPALRCITETTRRQSFT